MSYPKGFDFTDYEEVEVYRDITILQYASEGGYRADLGTKRTKRVETLQEARELIDFYHDPPQNY